MRNLTVTGLRRAVWPVCVLFSLVVWYLLLGAITSTDGRIGRMFLRKVLN
jgi:hypothetical protein